MGCATGVWMPSQEVRCVKAVCCGWGEMIAVGRFGRAVRLHGEGVFW